MPYDDTYLNDAEGLNQAIEGQEAVVLMVRAGCPLCENTKAFLASADEGSVPVYLLEVDTGAETFLEGRGVEEGLVIDGRQPLLTIGRSYLPVAITVDETGKATSASMGPIDNVARLGAHREHSDVYIANDPALEEISQATSGIYAELSGDSDRVDSPNTGKAAPAVNTQLV